MVASYCLRGRLSPSAWLTSCLLLSLRLPISVWLAGCYCLRGRLPQSACLAVCLAGRLLATVFEAGSFSLAVCLLLSSRPPISVCLAAWLGACYCLRDRLSQSAWLLPGCLTTCRDEADAIQQVEYMHTPSSRVSIYHGSLKCFNYRFVLLRHADMYMET